MRQIIAFTSNRGWKIVQPLYAAGVNPIADIRCTGGVIGYLRAFCRLIATLLKTDKNACVLTDTPHYIGIMAYLGSILFGRMLIYRLRGDVLSEYSEQNKVIHAMFFRYLMMRKCKELIAVSHYLKRKLVTQGFPETKIQVVHLPQVLPASTPLAMEQRYKCILIVTSFKLRNKCTALNNILPELDRFLSDHAEFTVAIAGGGQYLLDFAYAAAHCRNSERIILMGFIDDIAKYYERSLVLVHVSDLDAYPSVINEARAFGTPVVAGNTVGMPEQVKDGEDGIVLKSRGDLLIALEQILHAEIWRRLSENGRARVARCHSMKTIGSQLKEALKVTE